MSELKPCPFCGGKAIFKQSKNDPTVWRCGCNSCDVIFFKTGAERAWKAWNTRHEPTCNMEKSLVFGDGGAFEGIGYECSSCKNTFNDVMNYCPNCGCRVVNEGTR